MIGVRFDFLFQMIEVGFRIGRFEVLFVIACQTDTKIGDIILFKKFIELFTLIEIVNLSEPIPFYENTLLFRVQKFSRMESGLSRVLKYCLYPKCSLSKACSIIHFLIKAAAE